MAMAIAFIIMFFGILIGGHLYGRYLASFHSTRTENTIAELRAQAQKETRRSNSLSAQLTEMEAKLQGAQAALDSIMPASNTPTCWVCPETSCWLARLPCSWRPLRSRSRSLSRR